MNRKLLLVCCVAAPVLCCATASFAQQQTAVGPGVIPLSATGVLNGVAMSSSGITGTLSVGVVGGPEMDIFTANNPPAPGLVAISTGASSQGNVVFNSSSTVFGGIGVTQPGGPFLRDISGGNAGTTVNFEGSVFATSLNVSGTGVVNFNSGSTNITATNFGADGTIGLAPKTIVIGALTTTAGADTGTLALGGASVLDGAVGGAVGLRAVNVVGGSNLAGVSATITGAVDAYTFSLGTNTLNIGGALTLANGGTGGVINTTLASPTLFGNIRPVGATNLGPTLLVNVLVPSTTFIPVGSSFNIVQTQAGTVQSGTNGSIVHVTIQDPTNPLYSFAAVPAAGTVAGLVTITTTAIPLLAPILPPPPGAPPPSAPPPPATPIVVPVIPVLLSVPPTSGIIPVLAAINNLTDVASVVNAIAQLAPSTADLAAPLVTFQGSRQFETLWLSHLDDFQCGQVNETREGAAPTTQPSSCRMDRPHSGWWAKGFGYFGHQGAEGAFDGYGSTIAGGMMGYDMPLQQTPLGGETRVGLSVGYARSTIDGRAFDANTGFDTYQATAYIAHDMGAWFVDGNLSYGWNDYAERRHILFPGVDRVAQGKYSGEDYGAYIVTGYRLRTDGFTITPLASLQYTHENLNGYSETGADAIDLTVNAQHYDFLESTLGVTATRAYGYRNGTFVPEVHFKWLHELVNPSFENTAAFAGSQSFVTSGLKGADDTFNPGFGLTFLSCSCTASTWSLEAVYDYYWTNSNYSAQRVMLKFSDRF